MLDVLHEIESSSSRKPAILEPIIDNIADLLVSPQGNVRAMAHNLIAKVLKHRPSPNLNILAAFQRCLDSPRADVLMSALDRLPDIVLCMQGKKITNYKTLSIFSKLHQFIFNFNFYTFFIQK